jgi:hypothetical protein
VSISPVVDFEKPAAIFAQRSRTAAEKCAPQQSSIGKPIIEARDEPEHGGGSYEKGIIIVN